MVGHDPPRPQMTAMIETMRFVAIKMGYHGMGIIWD
jgi:hypothetical protein